MNETIRRLEELHDLTSHRGWAHLMEDLAEREDVLKDALTRNEVTPYELGIAQGHLKVYRELQVLRKMIDVAIKQANEDALDEAANV